MMAVWSRGVGKKKDIFVHSNHVVLKSLKISAALNIEGTIFFLQISSKIHFLHTQKKVISQGYMFRKLNENSP